MTAEVHNHSMQSAEQRTDRRVAQDHAARRTIGPRWLLPVLVAVPLITALLVSGVVSPTFLVYAGLFGGCALMHVFGHSGHGGSGHGGSGTADRG